MYEQMIRDTQNGDREVANQLCIQLYSPLKNQCAKLLKGKSQDDRQDAVQEAMSTVLTKIRTFTYKSDRQFLSWCYDILYYSCLPFTKKDKVVSVWAPEDLPELAAPEAIESGLGCEDIAEQINRLAPGARKNAELFFIEGHNHKEIAEIMDITPSASSSTISRVRPVLYNWLLKLGFYGK